MNKKILSIKNFISSTLLATLLSGCSAKGVLFKDDISLQQEPSTIYLYRPDVYVNSAGYPNVYLNGEKVGKLYEKGYLALHRPPGEYSIELKNFFTWDGAQKWKITLAEMEKRYFKVTPGFAGPDSINQQEVIIPIGGATITMNKSVTILEVEKAHAENELLTYRNSSP